MKNIEAILFVLVSGVASPCCRCLGCFLFFDSTLCRIICGEDVIELCPNWPETTTLPLLHEDATRYQTPKPTVNFSLEWSSVTDNGGNEHPVSLVWFRCDFEPSLDEDLLYRVTWYSERGVQYSTELGESADDWLLKLNESEYLNIGFRMGDHLSCSVTAFKEEGGPPGRESEQSDQTLIGIKILTPSVTSDSSDDDIVVKLQPTVPIRCLAATTCKIPLTMYIPESTCAQSVIPKKKSCGIEFDSANWSAVYEIPMEEFTSDEYKRDMDFNVYLSTFEDTISDIIWKGYKLPPIKIHVRSTQETYEGKMCFSRNDPHLITFDGRRFDSHQSGTFIMYLHKEFKTEIQVQYKTCRTFSGGVIKCNCGVAVSAGLDLFVIDVCDPARKRIGYKHCDANLKSLVVSRKPGNKYEIFFNYGTFVRVSLVHMYGSWLLEVHVIPSKSDQGVDKTVGLCGRLDGDCSNDFYYSDGSLTPDNLACGDSNNWWNYYRQPLTFINSWKITDSANDMFRDDYSTPDMAPMNYSVCSCTKVPQYAGPTNIITCDKDTAATCTQGQFVVGSHSCSVSRRRRSVTRKQTIPKFSTDQSELPLSTDRLRREVPDEPLTLEEATRICTESLAQAPMYTLCTDVPSTKPFESVEICIQDLLVELCACGASEELCNNVAQEPLECDKSWVARSLENMQDACTMELRRNKTFSEDEPAGRTIAEQIINEACPNNCSSRGLCIKGVCQCDEGWCGGDCSLDASSPLRLAGILDDGLCDEFELTCDYAYVFGDVFSDVDQLTCRLEEFFILPSGVREYANTHHVLAETETMFETRCPLASSRRRREVSGNQTDAFISGFTISISNNGTVYSNGVDLFIFNSECQLIGFSGGSVYLSVKAGYCFIEGQCMQQGFPHPNENCKFCDSGQSGTSWSFVEDGQACVLPQSDNYLSLGVLVAVCLSIIAIIALATAAVVYLKCKSKNRTQKAVAEPVFAITIQPEKVANHKFDPRHLRVTADTVKPLYDSKYTDA